MERLLYIGIGLVFGGVIGYLLGQRRRDANDGTADEAVVESLRSEKEKLAVEKAAIEGRLEKSIEVFNDQRKLLDQRDAELKSLGIRAERLDSERRAMEEKLQTQAQEIERINERFKNEFKMLADQILKQNTRDFAAANNEQIGTILNPLKERIQKFEERVNQVYAEESGNRSQLMGQVQALMDLNKRISEEATNLTNALKGDTKTQGTWGEMILERILESSGLQKGEEYETQVSNRTEDGVFRPDVIVRLPDQKVVIIDSKVSLTAYEAYINAELDEDRKRFLDQHIASMRTHVKTLSAKDYPSKARGETLDFTLMFVPIEAGFSEALKRDMELYSYAWENRIVIVSPTTLLATLRTVASVWKQEKQNRNVQEIARLAGTMYDKFVGFVDDIQRVEKSMDNARTAIADAKGKLSTGRGNLVHTADKIKSLGAKTTKELPAGSFEQIDE